MRIRRVKRMLKLGGRDARADPPFGGAGRSSSVTRAAVHIRSFCGWGELPQALGATGHAEFSGPGSGVANRPLGGVVGERYEVEAEVVGAAALVQECLVGADDGVCRCGPWAPIEAMSESAAVEVAAGAQHCLPSVLGGEGGTVGCHASLAVRAADDRRRPLFSA
jgi:hypothetical protein